MERETFIFHKDWFDSLEGFESEIKLKIIGAIVEYALYGKLPTDQIILYSPFAMIRKLIDRDNEKYQSICLRNKQNGHKGGRPRKDTQSVLGETQQNPKNPSGFQETQKTQVVFEKPNETQRNPKNLDTDTYTNTYTETITETDNNSSKELFSEPNGSVSTDVAVDSRQNQNEIDFNEIAREFNLAMLGKTIPQIVKLNDKRKSLLRVRIKEYGRDAVSMVIRKASESYFLNGDNKNGWRADFDWIFSKTYFPKVLEGNYDNAKPTYDTNNAASGHADQTEVRNDEFMRHIIGKIGNAQNGDNTTLW